MSDPSIRFPESIIATTFVNITILLSIILSSFAVPTSAQTTIISTTIRPITRPITSTTAPYSILPFFLPDSEPLSLIASIVHKTTIITTTIISSETTVTSLIVQTLTTAKALGNSDKEDEITLEIDCPTAFTPENEACRSARIYPALVTGRRNVAGTDDIAQTQVWKGETTYLVGDDATTTWTCWQGMSMRTAAPAPTEAAIVPLAGVYRGGGMVPYAQCVSTIVQDQGSSVRFVTRKYDECYFYRHMVPLVVSNDGRRSEDGSEEARKMNDGWGNKLAGLGCDAEGASRTMWAGSVKTQVTAATGTASAATSGCARGWHRGHIMSRVWVMMLWPLVVALVGSWIHVWPCTSRGLL